MTDDRRPTFRVTRGSVVRVTVLAAIALVAVVVAQTLLVLAVCLSHHRGDRPMSESLQRLAVDAGGITAFECVTEDGVPIQAEILGDFRSRPVVVFGHGFRGRGRQGDHLAPGLLSHGFAMLLFDYRGCGASGGSLCGIGAVEGRDVDAVLRHLDEVLKVAPERTAYVGISMGAAAGVQARRVDRLGAIVLAAPYNRLSQAFTNRIGHFTGLTVRPWFTPAMLIFQGLIGVDPDTVNPVERVAALTPTPLLVIGGTDDWRVPSAELEQFFAAAAPPKEFVMLPEIDHIELGHFPDAATTRIVEFLERTIQP